MMDLVTHLGSHWNYLAVITLMMIGLYIAISSGNLVKKVVGINIFQASVISISGATSPG